VAVGLSAVGQKPPHPKNVLRNSSTFENNRMPIRFIAVLFYKLKTATITIENVRERERERETDRQTDRQTDR